MNYQCYADNCVSNPVGYCLCSWVPIIFCFMHSHEHKQINTDHRMIDIKANPPSDSLKKILKVNQFKNSLKNTKRSVFAKSAELVLLLDNLNQSHQNQINKLIKDCDETISRLALQDENTRVINNDCIISKLASDQIQNKLKGWHDKMIENFSLLQDMIKQTLDISNLCENHVALVKETKQLNPSNSKPLKIPIKQKSSLPQDQIFFKNQFIFFKNLSKELKTINLDSLETQVKELTNLQENIISWISICELPNKSIFCYGNRYWLTFIIDQAKNIRLLPNGNPNYALDSKYYNNFVYAIGGQNKLAEKFNLSENKWESCAPIPYNYDFACSRTAIIGNKMIIAGYRFGKVIKYDIKIDNYQILSGINLVEGVYKFVFSSVSRVYIGECENNVFESGENDLTRWSFIARTNPVADRYQISYFKLINESVYFMNSALNLYEFKLRTKELKLIKNYE